MQIGWQKIRFVWIFDEEYRKLRGLVTGMKVVNDAAERGIKHSQDFLSILIKDSEVRKQIMILVQDNRERVRGRM